MKPNRVPAIYTRVCCDSLAASGADSLQTQELTMRRYQRYLNEHGPEPRVFHEETGAGHDLDRPALGRLVQAIERGEISSLLVTRIRHLTPSLPDFLAFHALLKRHGVTLMSKAECLDTGTPLGRAMLQLLSAFEDGQGSPPAAGRAATPSQQSPPTRSLPLGSAG